MSVAAPRELKEMTIANASRGALAPYGTTPEKLKASLDFKQNEATGRLSTRQLKSSKGSDLVASKGLKQTISSNSTSFPPLSSVAPTPVSQKISLGGAQQVPKKDVLTSKPPMPKPSMKSLGGQLSGELSLAKKVEPSLPDLKDKLTPSLGKGQTNSKSPSKASESILGTMKGLGDALNPFPSKGGISSSSGSTALGIKQPAPLEKPDYKSILTKFYEKHNPQNLNKVDINLEKYKVSST